MLKEIRLVVISDAKQVHVHITNPEDCAKVEGVSAIVAENLHGLIDFANAALETHSESGSVAITPESARKHLAFVADKATA